MKNLFLIVLIVLSISMSYAQIGIGTEEPKTTLDVQGEPTNTALPDGVSLPTLSLAELEAKLTATPTAYDADQDGVMVFINDITGGSTLSQTAGITGKGIYYFSHDGTTGTWSAVGENKLWSTRGNAGTDEANDFIGTTDNTALNFRVNNIKSGRIGTLADGSVFLGYEAGLNNDNTSLNRNTFIGFFAGRSTTTGNNNTGVGSNVLGDNETGIYNTAIGSTALGLNIDGNFNTAIGASALNLNTSGSSNTSTGYRSLLSNTTGNANTANGFKALYSNTTGDLNTAIGFRPLYYNTVGSNNLAIGNRALYSNTANSRSTAVGTEAMEYADDRTSGRETFNTALGYQALRGSTTAANNTGRYNTAIGDQALYSNIMGNYNTATGEGALYSNTGGDFNTAFGRRALYFNTTGNLNTAIGDGALFNNTTGFDNTAIGRTALFANTTGSNNTALGASANSVGDLTNSTALGYNAEPLADNTIRLGNTAVTTIGGYANWTNVSDGRFKQNVKENVVGLEFINKLRPVTYNLDMDALAKFNKTPDSLRLRDAEQLKAAELQTGFIAQEVEQAAQEVGYDFHGVDKPKNANSHYGLRYAEFVVPLVKAVQEQQEEIENQNSEIETLKNLIEMQQSQIKVLMEKVEE